MPELPDVAVYKRYLDRTALHKKVVGTRVFDDDVIKDTTARTLQRRVKDHTFETSRRRGKHLFVGLGEDDGWLGMHFGMTGYLKYFKDDDDTPEHTRVRFEFDNGYYLAYVCRRKFGEVRVINDVDGFIEEHQLGPDAWEADFETFKERIGDRRGGIKSALMNQKALAGMGNVYTDEVLFQARIHPETQVSDLDDDDLRILFDAMQKVIEKSIDAKANPDEMPRSFLLPHREEGSDCPNCGGKIQKSEVNGRPTYHCPSCSRNP